MNRDLVYPPRSSRLFLITFCLSLTLHACVYDAVVEEPYSDPPVEQLEPYFVSIEATLSSIQDSLFSGTCQNSRCHDCCWNAAELDLTRGESYANLVNVPSMQNSSILRVHPGKPDSSYLIWKLEGHPDMNGARMPIWSTRQPLDPGVIQVIRDWIEAGAKDEAEESQEN